MNVSRREFVAGSLVAGALGGTARVRGASRGRRVAAIGDWPTAHYDVANTGYAAGEAPAKLPLTDTWSGADEGFATGPAVAGGDVYAGTTDGAVVAVDAASGTERWRYEADSAVRTTPAVGPDLVFFGCDDGTVRAVDTADRTEFWRTQTGAAVTGSPTLVGDTVYAANEDGIVHALDTFDGAQRWQYDAGGGVRTTPAVVDGTVYVGNVNGRLTAIDAKTSRGEWSTYVGGREPLTAPVVTGNRVLVGSEDGAVYALTRGGDQTWKDDTGSSISVPPAVVDGTAIVVSDDASVRRIKIGGARQWTSYANTGVRAPAVAGKTVYVPSEDGQRLYLIDLANGRQRGVHDLAGTPTTPAVVDGHLFMGVGGRLTAFRQQESTPTPTGTLTPTATGTSTPGPSERTATGEGGGGPVMGDPSGGSNLVLIAAIAATGVGAMVTLLLWLQSKT